MAAASVEADGVLSLHLASLSGSALPRWTPGAHIDVILPNGLVRQYSLCGDPDLATWRIGVLREPASRGGSKCIHDEMAVGDRIQLAGPRNNFKLVDAERYLFIAGGIGITPILAMIRQVAAAGLPWTLLYGGRTRSSMAFLDEIAGFAGGDVHIAPQDECGLLDLQRFLGQQQQGMAVFCCGPGPLIDAVEDKCRTWMPGSLHRERFAPSNRPPLPKGAFEVELARSRQRLTVPAHRSLLAVLQEAGHSVTHSCTAGICGTCLVKVLAGVPQHNDDVLSDEEREAGGVMLVCVSRSDSELLVLDL
ncbi:ferredoxin [Devosia limi DSM 17137]|uniref:Ferredoxin n=1 Tax=Devosia limi DSM 17137 TaxID=1121477 RepID=A0A0F5LTP8_9HYPH|nr:ferredoxin [Devosia limi DSM 17137]